MIATVLVSFACAMQVQSFRKVNGFSYASTMCIGNLRSGTAALSFYLRERRPEQLRQAMYYFGNHSSVCDRSRNRRQSFCQLRNPYDMGIVRTFDCQLPADVPGYRSTEKQSIIEEKIRDIVPLSDAGSRSRLVSVLQYFVAWKHSVQDRCVLPGRDSSDESEEFPPRFSGSSASFSG